MGGLLRRLCFLDREEARRRELYHPAPNVGATKELRHHRLRIRGRQRLVKAVFNQNGSAIGEAPENLFRLEGGRITVQSPTDEQSGNGTPNGEKRIAYRVRDADLAAKTSIEVNKRRIAEHGAGRLFRGKPPAAAGPAV